MIRAFALAIIAAVAVALALYLRDMPTFASLGGS